MIVIGNGVIIGCESCQAFAKVESVRCGVMRGNHFFADVAGNETGHWFTCDGRHDDKEGTDDTCRVGRANSP